MSNTTTTTARTATKGTKATPAKPATKATPKATPAKGKNYKALADKMPTEVHQNFVTWVKEQVGVDVDLKSVQIAFSLRHDFQRSEANQANLKARRDAAKKAEAARQEARKAKVLAEARALGLV